MLVLGIFAAVLAAYELAATRLGRLGISRPMVFVAVGALVTLTGAFEPLPGDEPAGVLLPLAEIALALVLFADASRVNLAWLRRDYGVALRLLGPGMLMTIGLGTLLGLWLFGLNGWECAALAAILAPTDAALGAAVVEDERVPRPIRQALSVEAGLNDGLAVPFLLLFVAGATVSEGFEPGSYWASTALEKVGIGLLAGVAVGAVVAELARRGRRAGWASGVSEQLAMAAAAVALFAFTEELGGSGFIAAYVGGLVAGSRLGTDSAPAVGFVDEEGTVVGAFVFFALGLVALELLDALTATIVVYALLSLTVIRMLPVALALLGSGLRARTVAFVGWFGPRGLASIVLALVVLEQDDELRAIDTVVLTTLVTVILSILLHGLSAGPLTRRYGGWAKALPPDAPELAGPDDAVGPR
ncbi:MAG: cation:proton antiporter [Solirubrobacterales bacterium]